MTALSEVVAGMTGDEAVVVDDESRLVVLRHGKDWRVGFRLTRYGQSGGPWHMVEMATIYSGKDGAAAHDIRALPIGALLSHARAALSRGDEVPNTTVGKVQIVDLESASLAAFLADARTGGKRTDEDFAKLARAYALLVEKGSSAPAKALSERHGKTPGQWANWTTEARHRGLLTKVRPGQSGGCLTAKAERILGLDQAD